MDWNSFQGILLEKHGNHHRLMPPCPLGCIQFIDQRWGKLPPVLCSMYRLFNGAELYIDSMPMLTILGIPTDPPQPPLIWPGNCCIDYWLTLWRSGGNLGWPIARTNYDSLWIFHHETVREWDRSIGDWAGEGRPLLDWTEQIIENGNKYLAGQ